MGNLVDTITNSNAQNAAVVFRALSRAGCKTDNPQSLFTQTANELTNKEKNKTGITLLLEDYTEKINGGDKKSIKQDDTKKIPFFTKLGNLFRGRENIFNTEGGKALFSEKQTYIDMNDVFYQTSQADGGVKYADIDNGDNLYKAALNFAKADIDNIKTAMYPEDDIMTDWTVGKSLKENEVKSYSSFDAGYSNKESKEFKALSIYNKKGISPEEYASYMILADGINGELNGIISPEEVEAFKQLSDNELTEQLKEIYKKSFK